MSDDGTISNRLRQDDEERGVKEPRRVASINFSTPYVEGTWMVGAYDNCEYDQVHIVGPDENFRLVVELKDDQFPKYGAPIMTKIERARWIAEVLTKAEQERRGAEHG